MFIIITSCFSSFFKDHVQVYCYYFISNDNHVQGVKAQSAGEELLEGVIVSAHTIGTVEMATYIWLL